MDYSRLTIATSAVMAFTLGMSLAAPVMARERGVSLPYRSGVEIEYEVVASDRPAQLQARLLRPDIRWRHIEVLNGLAAGAPIRPGQILRVPVTWLKFGPKFAKVESISGKVSINGKPADIDSKFTENDAIETGSDGIVVVRLPDGTEMSIAPSSLVRIERLRQYFDGDTVDARLRLERGQMESDSPEIKVRGPINSKRDIRIRTPKATAAVRGTQFRVSDSGAISTSSVLSGKVNWKAAKGASDIPKGFGASATANGSLTAPEALLQAPRVGSPEKAARDTTTKIAFDPIPGAVAYQVRIAANTKFSSDISTQIVTEPLVRVVSQRDGNHFIAVRGISESGVSGLDGIGKVTFLARPVAPALKLPRDKAVNFAESASLTWQPNPQATSYRVQVAANQDFSDLLIDEEVTTAKFSFSRRQGPRIPIRRFWRVAAMDGWTTGPFTDISEFVLNVDGPKPAIKHDDDGVLVQWESLPGARYTVLVDPASGGNSESLNIQTDEAHTRLTGLDIGRYDVRVIARFGDSQLSTRAGDATSFRIQKSWTDNFGNPIDTRDGPLQLSP